MTTLNGVECSGYGMTEQGLSATLVNCTYEQAKNTGGGDITIAVDGKELEILRGFTYAKQITENCALHTFTVLYPYASDTDMRVDTLEQGAMQQRQETERLAAENKQLKAQVKAANESNAMLEECVVEMAGIVYA